ncbi:TPA: toxin-antitoxin system HicB family antitoxin [Vibrio alginolyticus]|uniref:toxin-antitoxin system HicB family antitoxin n=1 Tax=Vibrio harveyi group TaxID=717610 RepID=UPI001D7DE20F|nr:toxin-antitoxin system HicB family antitoxin [Vibrio parahaemolyticus]EGR0148633.1 toxin-antitoxin system HicB family antitoxin [Vibrio alginolyticus]EJG1817931.1 toxin-antitoxin system HicB family antitoxin [Vibrio parahaemolyticus]MCG6453882.1 type II toxin-antitoxin system HicB family antitoxin [Vibrio parahaemolyticus]
MSNFDPEFYSISVRKENVEGESLYVARVAEFPDVMEFADSYQDAHELALDTISTAYELCKEQDIPFPEPMDMKEDLASGRVTLRMPRTLHSRLISLAELEDVSLNQYIVSALSVNYGQCNILEKVSTQILEGFSSISHRVVQLNRDVKGIAKASHHLHSAFSPSDIFIEGPTPYGATKTSNPLWTIRVDENDNNHSDEYARI